MLARQVGERQVFERPGDDFSWSQELCWNMGSVESLGQPPLVWVSR